MSTCTTIAGSSDPGEGRMIDSGGEGSTRAAMGEMDVSQGEVEVA